MKQAADALTENIVVRITPKEKALLEKHAKKEGWSISEYVRATMVGDMAMMQGDVEAMKIIFDYAKGKFAERFTRKFKPFLKESAEQ